MQCRKREARRMKTSWPSLRKGKKKMKRASPLWFLVLYEPCVCVCVSAHNGSPFSWFSDLSFFLHRKTTKQQALIDLAFNDAALVEVFMADEAARQQALMD